jgi:peptidoglycan hydrolase-like protein with peptidoglycan-binding domain
LALNIIKYIKKGSVGEDVRQVQICMNSLGHTTGETDGMYGPNTYAGITKYQTSAGLQYIDGIVGPETSTALNALSN